MFQAQQRSHDGYFAYMEYRREANVPENPEVPDVYTDQLGIAQSPYGVCITFSLSPRTPVPGQQQATPQAIVRMSLEHAKIMTMILRKRLKQYELEDLGDPIRIPSQVMRQLGLSNDDW